MSEDALWEAVVKAPQGGPVYTHHFEGGDPSAMLHEIADALDLSRADGVQISMAPVERLRATLNRLQDQSRPSQGGVYPNRVPRLAFNADEADCCTCVGKCYGRTDGICRCLAPA